MIFSKKSVAPTKTPFNTPNTPPRKYEFLKVIEKGKIEGQSVNDKKLTEHGNQGPL